MSQNLAQGVRWNLSDLYASNQDPNLDKDLKTAESLAIGFEKKYKPLFEKLKSGAAFPLAELLKDYKAIVTLLSRIGAFAHLSFSEKTNDPAAGAFMQKIQTQMTEIETHLVFFDVSWNKLEAQHAEKLMSEPAVKADLHFLEHMRIYAPHTLSEAEEKIMSIKSNTGRSAFSRLFDEVINNIKFPIQLNGKAEEKSESEILALFHSPDRKTRQKASDSLAHGLTRNTHLLTYIYNMILADHRDNIKIRSYEHPMDGRNLANEITRESVLSLIQAVKKAYPIAQRYYQLKRKLLNLPELYDYDRYAPLEEQEEKIPFEECKRIVLEGYYQFSEEAGKITEQFFTKKWIDAEIRPGKQGGGFCASTIPEVHPYILVNYTGSLRDVMTVAHELGHGLHQYLAAKRVGILESSAPLTLAETASVFGEMLIFEKIMQQVKDPKKRLALVCGKIDDNFATVYRQIAMTDFELKAHEAGLKEGELPSEKLSDFWIQANAEFYGDSVKLSDNYRHGWKYIPHFVHTPFYCYAYSFAQLFVLTLFQKYKENRQGFVPKYFEMLSLGGSRKPNEIAALAGLNLQDKNFWSAGIDLLESFVKEAETLTK